MDKPLDKTGTKSVSSLAKNLGRKPVDKIVTNTSLSGKQIALSPLDEQGDVKSASTAIREAYENGEYPYAERVKAKDYEKQKRALQVELLKVQKWVEDTDQKIILIFEGRDAAGKGGTIKRFMEHLNPRKARVVALNKPTDIERHQWYFQRYVNNLPK